MSSQRLSPATDLLLTGRPASRGISRLYDASRVYDNQDDFPTDSTDDMNSTSRSTQLSIRRPSSRINKQRNGSSYSKINRFDNNFNSDWQQVK